MKFYFFRNDITEEMKQEHEHSEKLQAALLEAQHANAMKSEFLSNVSHDMRTPLNAVIGYTDLAKKAQTVEEIKDYLDKLERAGKIILSLVNDTLDLSKIESGAITLKPAPISCAEIVKKILSTIQPAADEKHIHLVVDESKAVMATLNLDSLRLQDIFINLLSNAIKFTPENGTVTLTIECIKLEEKCVHDKVIVSDTGCGMSPEFLPKAFEPFTQERLVSTAGIGGSGLGLSIVKKLVELMGGTIDVKSELGKGTEFTVCLDFERVPDNQINNEISIDEKEFESLKGKKVLLVEDNEMNTEIAKLILEAKGMIVTCANNGQTACDLFSNSKQGDFDLILMDIRMPVMNGLEATKKIRKMNHADAKTIPIIAMSANAFDDDIKTSLDAGMNGHIAKPVNPQQLYEVLSKNSRRN